MAEKAKRERSVNWEQGEKELFRVIIRPFIPIIDNKDISTNANKLKIHTWNKITSLFNKVNKRSRNRKQLMNQWKCTKIKAKKEMLYRREALKTGDSDKPPSPRPDPLAIFDIIPKCEVNELDCDNSDIVKELSTINETDCEISNNDDQILVEDDISRLEQLDSQRTTPTSELDQTLSDSQLLPSTSQTFFNREQTTNGLTSKHFAKNRRIFDKFNFAQESFEDLHRFRVLENERQQKEHEFRMKNMAEIQSQVMVNLKLQEEILHRMLGNVEKN